jgi:hypothetical protein
MEATIFTGWIYDPCFRMPKKVKVPHPLMLLAIAERLGTSCFSLDPDWVALGCYRDLA